MRPHIGLALVALVFGLAVLSVFRVPDPTSGAPITGPTIEVPASVTNPNNATITVTVWEQPTSGVIVVTASAGVLLPSSCVVRNVAPDTPTPVPTTTPGPAATPPPTSPCTNFVHTGTGTGTVTITAANDTGTVGDVQGDEVVDLIFTYLPPRVATPTTVTITACQDAPTGACTPATPATACQGLAVGTCTAAGILVLPGSPTLVVNASPNLLPCAGGTSTITATLIDAFGNTVATGPSPDFHFSTTGGLLAKTGANTATLTLSASTSTATVTAAAGASRAEVTVRLDCPGRTFFIASVSASPNVLPCGGGTSTITAVAISTSGSTLSGVGFRFTTSAGQLVQSNPNSATLSLSPGTGTRATVTASTIDSAGQVVDADVTVMLGCNEFMAVVVTAAPNVVSCGGQSLITATARDANGHVVPGVGFHFTTDTGGLIVGPPNTAEAQQGQAILTVFPGMDSATVKVSVGTVIGTVQGQVTVQQFCPSSFTTAGGIALRASEPNPFCGSSVFISATLKDVTNNVVPDGTEVNFLSSSGKLNPSSQSTRGGTLNIIFTADATPGSVVITAASGAAFGSITLNVRCGEGVAGANGRITPPSTGDSGLAGGGDR